jgi:RHH-type proline utilization regulon transcriptional repressor/proline dehydrogenase/delta 1-pyrroline-5-carboxylate dehydrogenase
VKAIADGIHAGNIYVNRNQIGAVVGSQPFGGEGLSGTGPKAGGPHYLPRLRKDVAEPAERVAVLPGPTGESNTLHLKPRGVVLCLGPTEADRRRQVEMVETAGGTALISDDLNADAEAALYFGSDIAGVRRALSQREGAIVPLSTSPADGARLLVERHVCIDTTAAGGNASLMASAQEG